MMKPLSRGLFKRPTNVNYSNPFSSFLNKESKSKIEFSGPFQPFVIAIGGGKGGIGKSFIASNLGLSLAELTRQVTLVDLDFGAANLHSCLGTTIPRKGVADLIAADEEQPIDEFSSKTHHPHLQFYGAGQEFNEQYKLTTAEKQRLMFNIGRIQADFVILDLGAGTHSNTLDFFLQAHMGVLVVVPEPTSIENAYVFLKSIFFRKLQNCIQKLNKETESKDLLQNLINPHLTTSPIEILAQYAEKNQDIGAELFKEINEQNLAIIMNQVRTKLDRELGGSMCEISRKYFGMEPHLLGSIEYSDDVWKAVRNRKSVFTESPQSSPAKHLQMLGRKLIEIKKAYESV